MQRKKEEIEKLKKQYPNGTRVRLLKMDAIDPVPAGTIGVIDFVDDGGMIHMDWSNGQNMAIDPQEDRFEVLDMGKVVYVPKKFGNVFQGLKREEADFHIGVLKEQFQKEGEIRETTSVTAPLIQGEDGKFRADVKHRKKEKSQYQLPPEITSVIQGEDKQYQHSTYATWKCPNEIDFIRASDFTTMTYTVIGSIELEIQALEKEIQKKQQEIVNVERNSAKVMKKLAEPVQDQNMDQDAGIKMNL